MLFPSPARRPAILSWFRRPGRKRSTRWSVGFSATWSGCAPAGFRPTHAQENTTLADQARQAALDELYGLGFDHDQQFDQRIQSVSVEDVVGLARRLFNHYVLVTTSPLPGARKQTLKVTIQPSEVKSP